MNQYEVMYVVDATLDESARTEVINRFSDIVKKNGGEIDRVDEWGKRRLAYAINDKPEGYYVLVCLHAPTELPKEIERNLRISEQILRCQFIRIDDKKHSVKPRAPRAAAPVEEAAEPAQEAATEETLAE